jgi:hypothetical protein
LKNTKPTALGGLLRRESAECFSLFEHPSGTHARKAATTTAAIDVRIGEGFHPSGFP